MRGEQRNPVENQPGLKSQDDHALGKAEPALNPRFRYSIALYMLVNPAVVFRKSPLLVVTHDIGTHLERLDAQGVVRSILFVTLFAICISFWPWLARRQNVFRVWCEPTGLGDREKCLEGCRDASRQRASGWSIASDI